MAWSAPTGWFASLGAATQAVIAQGKLIEVEGKWGAAGTEAICAGVPARIITAGTALTVNWGAARTHIIDNIEGIQVTSLKGCASQGLDLPDIGTVMTDVTEASQDVANGGYYTNIIDHLDTILTWTSPARSCSEVQDALDHIISSLGIQTTQMSTVFDGIYLDITNLFDLASAWLGKTINALTCASSIYSSLEAAGMVSLLNATDTASDSYLLGTALGWTNTAKAATSEYQEQIDLVYTDIKTEINAAATATTAISDISTMLGTLNSPGGTPSFPV